jgi:signal transduction histidine kinase
LDEVRRIGRELSPEALDGLGLVSALIALAPASKRRRGSTSSVNFRDVAGSGGGDQLVV